MKFDPNGVRETYAKMFLTLWNVHRFHADYAALDGFDPKPLAPTPLQRTVRNWIVGSSHASP